MLDDGRFEIFKPGTGQGARQQRSETWRLQKGAAQKLFYFQANDVESVWIDGVGLGQHGNAAVHPKQLQDVEMFAGLWLDRFVSGDDQQNEVDAADAREHVAHEAFVSGHVDKPEAQRPAVGSGEFHVGESQIDGDATALLFFQAVRVDARESLYQRGLAVIDVSRRPDDDRFHLRES